MARNIEFEQESVLDAAMAIFWDKGYQGTSMQDLEKATTLKPGSIYNSFKSKKGLFLAVIQHYREKMVGFRIQTILNQGDPLQGIEDFFRTTYVGFEPEQLIGCMLTNTATELNNSDKDIQEHVAGGIEMIESAFLVRLSEAQALGHISPEVNLEQMALHLTSCYQGLCVVGRLTRDSKRLKVIADQALASLKKDGQNEMAQ
ncbi:TetR family transcriptional regulator [Alteromonadaceae bacterium M269]|nr:TetR family transcriptional regulator [Alteromonadaceae bacterium M269]